LRKLSGTLTEQGISCFVSGLVAMTTIVKLNIKSAGPVAQMRSFAWCLGHRADGNVEGLF